MPVICPTITAKNSDEYTKQMSEVASYIERIHIDLADGVFAPNKLLPIEDIWWPVGVIADIHVMYQAVAPFLDDLIDHHFKPCRYSPGWSTAFRYSRA